MASRCPHPPTLHPSMPLLQAPARRVVMCPILDDTTSELTHHSHLCCEQLLVGWMGMVTTQSQCQMMMPGPTRTPTMPTPDANASHQCCMMMPRPMRMPRPMPDTNTNARHQCQHQMTERTPDDSTNTRCLTPADNDNDPLPCICFFSECIFFLVFGPSSYFAGWFILLSICLLMGPCPVRGFMLF